MDERKENAWDCIAIHRVQQEDARQSIAKTLEQVRAMVGRPTHHQLPGGDQ
jgi:hypothetical protein